jgi:DNA-binding transcriptional LysR family regulator
METGDIDLAVGYVPQLRDKIRRARLFEEHYVCMTRPDHPLGRRGALTLKEFLSARHVLISSMGSGHQQLERALAENGVEEQRGAAGAAFRGECRVIVAGTEPGGEACPSPRSRAPRQRLVTVKVHPPADPAHPARRFRCTGTSASSTTPANLWLRHSALAELFGDRRRRKKPAQS